MKKVLLVVAFACSIMVHAQTLYSPAAIMAGAGDPVTLGIPCNSTVASTTTAYLFDNTTITAGASVSKCAWDPSTGTYHWFSPSATNPVTFYTSAGAQAAVKCWVGNTTSTATTGAWSISYSSAGITTILSVQAQAISTGGTYNTVNTATLNTKSATAASGYVTTGTSLLTLGATIIVQPVATEVDITACGI